MTKQAPKENSPVVRVTYARFLALKRLYATAVKEGKDEFKWQKQRVLTKYAKFLLQYLEMKFTQLEERRK